MFRRIAAFFMLSVLFLVLSVRLNAEEIKTNYDLSDPKNVVNLAGKMVMSSDYDGMLKITEMAEKRRTLEIVNSIESNLVTKAGLQKEADKILGFEVTGVEYVTNGVNKMCLVSTKWLTKIETFQPKNAGNFIPMDPSKDPETQKAKKTSSVVFVDYLLKLFDGKWKIVSRRSR
jgi:hypothetical protein